LRVLEQTRARKVHRLAVKAIAGRIDRLEPIRTIPRNEYCREHGHGYGCVSENPAR